MNRYSNISVLLALAPLALAQQPRDFITIDYPGASLTVARGINAQGDIVGSYRDATGYYGFVLDRRGLRDDRLTRHGTDSCRADGGWTTIKITGAVQVRPQAINASGDIAGQYIDEGGKWHGFLLSGGEVRTIDPEGATGVQYSGAYDINAQGDVVGAFSDANDFLHGYLWRDGVFTLLPDFVQGSSWSTPSGINSRGDIVGMYVAPGDPKMYGYVLKDGRFTKMDIASATTMVCGFKINDRGDIVGHYFDTSLHGFLLRDGVYIPIDFPAGVGTEALGINNRGDIVGDYTDGAGTHGFLWRRALPR